MLFNFEQWAFNVLRPNFLQYTNIGKHFHYSEDFFFPFGMLFLKKLRQSEVYRLKLTATRQEMSILWIFCEFFGTYNLVFCATFLDCENDLFQRKFLFSPLPKSNNIGQITCYNVIISLKVNYCSCKFLSIFILQRKSYDCCFRYF